MDAAQFRRSRPNMSSNEALYAFTNSIHPARRAWMMAVTDAISQTGLPSAMASTVLVASRLGPDATQKQLAQELGVDPAALVRTLDQGQEMQLLRRVVSPADRRIRMVELTDRGAELACQMEDLLDEVRGQILADLPREEVEIATRVMRLLEERALDHVQKGKAK